MAPIVTPSRAQRHFLPLVYLCLAIGLIALLLPTVLRPPQPPPPAAAAFNPDAPPDEQIQILTELSRATTRTAGAAAGAGAVQVAPATPPLPEAKPTRGGCFGRPPRQVESIYAAPCVPAYTGPRGGASYHNVSADEVHLGFYHSTDGCNGPIPDRPVDNESSGNRTMRVLQAYVNKFYETYGRLVRFYCIPSGSQSDAVTADEQYRIFASSSIDYQYCRDMVRRRLPVFCDPPLRPEMLAQAPYLWAWQMDRTSMEELGGEYYCKKLAGKTARFAALQSGYRGAMRKLGILTEESPKTGLSGEDPMVPELRRQCGAEPAVQQAFASGTAADEVATAIAKLKVEGVTTVVLDMDFGDYVLTLNAASAGNYYPEWLIFSPYGMDINIIGNLLPADQMPQVFGLSGWEWPRPNEQTECFRAYRIIDPGAAPDAATCGDLFPFIIQIMNGVQGAGPNLNSDTFRAGLMKLGHRYYEDIPYAIGGGYDSTDYTYIDTVGEIWWDAAATKPEDGTPGAYRWTRCGKRVRKAMIPREDPLVFQDGGSGPGFNGCPRIPGF